MRRRTLAFALLGIVLAIVFVRLGLWQLDRLRQRRARNATTASRLSAAPAPIASLPSDTSAHYRRVTVSGRYDYGHEIVLAMRSRNGAPGVNLVTPLVVGEDRTTVLVNRGWVYSPDGQSIDESKWREADTASVSGWIQLFESGSGNPTLNSDHSAFRWMDRAAAESRAGATLPAYYVVASATPGADSTHTPVRLPPPDLDEGPHLSYAIQWFSFAAIAVIGIGIVGYRELTPSSDRSL